MTEIRLAPPDVLLCPYIKMYFWGRDPDAPHVQRIVPNGEMGLCFYRSGPVSYVSVNGIAVRHRSCVMGQNLTYHDIVSEGNVEITGVHFTALGASVLLNSSVYGYRGRIVEISDTCDKELIALDEQINMAEGYEACFRLMDAFFLKRLCSKDIDVLNLRRLARAILYGQRHVSDIRVSDIASEACLSPRHFGRVFSDTVGMSPKDYMRLMRYRKTLTELKSAKGKEPLSMVAWRNGYYDFSHLTHDFSKISGYTPSSLLDVSANDDDEAGWRI